MTLWLLHILISSGMILLAVGFVMYFRVKPKRENGDDNPGNDPGFPRIKFPPGTPIGKILIDRDPTERSLRKERKQVG